MPPPNETTTAATLDRSALNAQVIADLAKAGVSKFTLLKEPSAAPRLIWQDKTIKSLEHFMPQPMRKRGAAELADAVADLVRVQPDPAHAIIGLKNHGLTITGETLEEILERVEPHILRHIPMA